MRRLSIVTLVAGVLFSQPAVFAVSPAADGASAQHASGRSARRRAGTARKPRRKMRGNRSTARSGGDAAAAKSSSRPLDPSGQPMDELIEQEEYRVGDPRAKRPPLRRTRERKEIPDISNPGSSSPRRPPSE